MSSLKPIKILVDELSPKLSPEKKRFNILSKQITKARKNQNNWMIQLPQLGIECDRILTPLKKAYIKTKRDVAFEVGRILDQIELDSEVRAVLTHTLVLMIQLLMEHSGVDEELKQLFDQHSSLSLDDFIQAEADFSASFINSYTNEPVEPQRVDETHDEFMDRMHEKLLEKIDQEKKKHHEQRVDKLKEAKPVSSTRINEVSITQSLLKDIYRKLASALHPDREQNPFEKINKTQQMQVINKAYKNKELLTLMQMQLEIEQINPSELNELTAEKITAYNQLLKAHLKRIHEETQHQVDQFCSAQYLPRLIVDEFKPEDLMLLINHIKMDLQVEIEALKDEIEFLYKIRKQNRKLINWIHQQLCVLDEAFEDIGN